MVTVLASWGAAARADAAEGVPPLPDELELRAERLTFDLEAGTAEARDLSLSAPGVELAADEATVELEAGRFHLLGARLRLELPGVPALHGAAEELDVEAGSATAREGSFSRCPLETAGWRIDFGEACGTADGDVTIRAAVLRIGDVPVFGTPWALLRFGRRPGVRPLELGAREGRGPFLRLAAFLPAGPLGDFELATTGFPMDDVDVAMAWLGRFGRIDIGVADLVFGASGFIRTEMAQPIGASGAVISRGTWAQEGFDPAGVVETSRDREWTGTRFPSVRADRFALLGGDFWTVAVGATTWQPAPGGILEAGSSSLPHLRMGWLPGMLGDVLRFPGAVRLGLWRALDGLLNVRGDTKHQLDVVWRQAVEVSIPGIPGVELRPFAVFAGRREAVGGFSRDFVWPAAGVRASLAAERAWGGDRYHRLGIDLRYARVLPAEADAIGGEVLMGPGPDLLRVGLPQVLRLRDVLLSGEAWLELRRLDGWTSDAAMFGARLEVSAPWLDVSARFAMDGEGDPVAAAAHAAIDVGGPVELLVHYAWLGADVSAVAPFLPWEERLATEPRGIRVVRHGIGSDVGLRAGCGRVALRVGAEADLEAPSLAALRVGLSFTDPARCLGLDLGAVFWLDEPVPNLAVALRL